ncbi:hypothetical protein C7434_0087 [Pantoea sp. PNA 14-12]|nr:hypothetical protein C7433_10691 [Pantoea sp. PNA 03-3]TDS71324.1 hypothetical protein C7434_0087 [Pantoea sp. PNA 14-12]WHS97966.1 MAG: hypothetical protein LZT29_00851 [Pantoea stewartii]
MQSEALPVVRKPLFRGRLRQLSWIAMVIACLAFWAGVLVLMV